jgi:hypothetical protein
MATRKGVWDARECPLPEPWGGGGRWWGGTGEAVAWREKEREKAAKSVGGAAARGEGPANEAVLRVSLESVAPRPERAGRAEGARTSRRRARVGSARRARDAPAMAAVWMDGLCEAAGYGVGWKGGGREEASRHLRRGRARSAKTEEAAARLSCARDAPPARHDDARRRAVWRSRRRRGEERAWLEVSRRIRDCASRHACVGVGGSRQTQCSEACAMQRRRPFYRWPSRQRESK